MLICKLQIYNKICTYRDQRIVESGTARHVGKRENMRIGDFEASRKRKSTQLRGQKKRKRKWKGKGKITTP